jgi:hypothetical protein
LKNTNALLHEQLVWLSFVVAENGHGEHSSAPVRKNVLPVQEHDALPAADTFVLLQFAHAPAPDAFLYVPAGQAVQGPLSGPVVPTGQTQPQL